MKEEFLEILSKYQGIIHKVNLIYFKNETDREDNFQEIVYQLWKSYPKIKNKDSIGSWIYAVSINNSISRVKKASRIRFTETVPDMPDNTDPMNDLSKKESFNLLISAVQDLDEINKSIILLYLEEKSYDEIAEIMGISKSNVGVRINRAKEILKQKLKNYGYEK